jgi:hypothetical protein
MPQPATKILVTTASLAAALLLTIAPLPSAAQDPIELRLHRVESYLPKFLVKKHMNGRYRPQLNLLRDEMHQRMKAGEDLRCAAQIFEEIHWMINYTDRSEAIERRLEDLRVQLSADSPAETPFQDPKDGSFGACFEEWIWRFFRSVDPLKNLAREGKTPEVPLKIWEPVDTPEEIEALFENLLISDESSGHNKRKELNLAITALGQLLWLEETASVFPEHLDREALAEALRRFVDERRQDPDTGYWGAWYRNGETLNKTNDLSMTFHILSYRDGQVARHQELANTTFAIRNVKYPYGWNTGGTQNNHHAYDVARIINYTWEDLDGTARAYAIATLFLLKTRSLAHSINDDGAFDPKPFTTVAEAYYFGVSFFDEAGIFGNRQPLSERVVITNTEDLLRQIEENLQALDPKDPWVAATDFKLRELKEARALRAAE